MNFIKLKSLIQVFANEYSKPSNIILLIGVPFNQEIKDIFKFIDCETIFVSNLFEIGIDIVSNYSDLPFEDQSFDIIINFTENDLFQFLKKNGTILTNYEVLNGKDYYNLNDTTFTVLN